VGTDICEPGDEDFQELLEDIDDLRTSGVPCDDGPQPTPTPMPEPTPDTDESDSLLAAIETVEAMDYQVVDPTTFDEEHDLRVLVGVRNDSDGYEQHAFFFYRDDYLGTDTWDPSASVTVAWQSNDTAALQYALYRPDDPKCCPTGGTAEVRYQWDGTQLVALDPIPTNDPDAPLSRR
jgi:hypothetical protein